MPCKKVKNATAANRSGLYPAPMYYPKYLHRLDILLDNLLTCTAIMQDFEIIIPIKDVQTMHTEFFWWKRYMKNDNPSVSIEKRYPQLWAFMNICNITLQITPKHEAYKFIFSHPEATQLIVDLKYMVDTPPTLLAFCEKLQVRVNNKVNIPYYVHK